MPHSLSLKDLGLTLPTITFQHQGHLVTRPITDHPPLIQNTVLGAVGTINILNPGSRLAPPAQKSEVQTLPQNGKKQMESMADYIFSMFQKGVVILALQEVPQPGSENFNYLVEKLKQRVGNSDLIDVSALSKQWLRTGTYPFGTSLLYNPAKLSIRQNARPVLANRAAEYTLVYLGASQQVSIANLHGNYDQQSTTISYIKSFQGICLGDTNIRDDITIDPSVLATAEKSSITIENAYCTLNTFDIIWDNYSRTINAQFTPNTKNIIKLQSNQTSFIPVIHQVDSKTAVKKLADFSSYLRNKKKNHLFNSMGLIIDVTLTSPHKKSSWSHITICNAEVEEEYLSFQQGQAVTPLTVNNPPNNIAQLKQEFTSLIDELLVIKNCLSENAKKDSSYSQVSGEVNNLFTTLAQQIDSFFSITTSSPSKSDFDLFQSQCLKAIVTAQKEAKNHRGWHQVNPFLRAFLGLLALITVGPALIVSVCSNDGYLGTFFGKPQTKTEKKLINFQQDFATKMAEVSASLSLN